ncbi:MAG: dUTPase [Puniceicoccales bacterium]|jgi:dimeric dUTPase (all-alpha-NTP-PPase superfamily)|nr:dUTPase [Puniceicoccales bacterium]
MDDGSNGRNGCKLAHIFELQKKFSQRLAIDMDALDDQKRMFWVLNYVRAMQQELAELTDSLPWKWWANYQHFDLQNAKVEVVDILHFLISTAQALGMSCDELYEKFCKKNEVNHARQDSGYSKKDDDDAKHI